jgi:hypothetical protein
MAISEDQRALLQLLLEREQTYADIAELLGISEADVRSRARATLEELGGSDPDADVALTDYLLGQADPIGRADVVRHLQRDSGAHALATSLEAKLRLLAPGAELPRLPGAKGKPVRRATPAQTDPPGGGETRRLGPVPGNLSIKQRRLLAVGGLLGIAAIVAVLFLTDVIGGDDEEPTVPIPQATETGDPNITEELVRVPMRPTGENTDAAGAAVFGIANEETAYLDISLSGLEKAPKDHSYVIWFLLNDSDGYPLAPIQIAEDGTFQNRIAIPPSALAIAIRTQSVVLSLEDNESLATDVEDAITSQNVLLNYAGDTILEGRIPRTEEPIGGADDLGGTPEEGGGAGGSGSGSDGGAAGAGG